MESSGTCKSNILNKNGERTNDRKSKRYSEMVSKRTTVIEKESHTDGQERQRNKENRVTYTYDGWHF